MAGALAWYGPGPLIVVDFGTAATFNALDERGKFLGGVIAPGLRVIAEGLTARTALLPPVRLAGAFPRSIGRNTSGALRAGALLGFRGMVREIVAALRAELGAEARVVATGGDARFLGQSGIAVCDVLDPELTLQGLRVIAARHHANTPTPRADQQESPGGRLRHHPGGSVDGGDLRGAELLVVDGDLVEAAGEEAPPEHVALTHREGAAAVAVVARARP